MRLGVDARVLVHRPTGVARYLSGVLGGWRACRAAGDRLEAYVDRAVAGELPGSPDAVHVLRWPLPGGDPAWRQLRLGTSSRLAGLDLLFCPFYTVPLLARVPTVVTIHDVSFAAHPEWFRPRSRFAFSLAGSSAHRARRVLTPSTFSATEIMRYIGVDASRIVVTPLGLDARWLEPVADDERAAARAWLGVDAPYVLHLGAVTARRQVDALVRAFAAVSATEREARLVVAGPEIAPSPDVAALAAEFGLGERLVRRDWVPEEHLRGLISAAQLLVYLSEYEGFGIPALEAMACGTAVLALRRASLPEVLGDAAAWIEEADPSLVAAEVEALLRDDTARADLAAAGLSRARQFTWGLCSSRTFEALRLAASSI